MEREDPCFGKGGTWRWCDQIGVVKGGGGRGWVSLSRLGEGGEGGGRAERDCRRCLGGLGLGLVVRGEGRGGRRGAGSDFRFFPPTSFFTTTTSSEGSGSGIATALPFPLSTFP